MICECSANNFQAAEEDHWYTNSATAIWQGFNHKWERTVVHLFDTPHRLGSFANYLIDGVPTATDLKFEANQTFTPGVNGDYAYPATYFTVANNVSWLIHTVKFEITDNASEEPSPYAESQQPFSFNIQTSNITTEGLENIGVIMNGYRIDMYCNPSLQPPGQVCNSNGIWPVNLTITPPSCSSSTQEGIITCDATFFLSRACNPSCSTPLVEKPFNYVMQYDVYLYYKVIAGEGIRSTSQPIIERSQNTRDGMIQGTEVIEGASINATSAIIALTGLSFDLSGSHSQHHNDSKTGRYLEQLSFLLSDLLYSEDTHQLAYDWQMGYYTVTTTMPSNATYTMSPLLLQFPSSSPSLSPSSSPAVGAVCIDDKLFKCHFNIDGVNLRQTTNSIVSISIPLN